MGRWSWVMMLTVCQVSSLVAAAADDRGAGSGQIQGSQEANRKGQYPWRWVGRCSARKLSIGRNELCRTWWESSEGNSVYILLQQQPLELNEGSNSDSWQAISQTIRNPSNVLPLLLLLLEQLQTALGGASGIKHLGRLGSTTRVLRAGWASVGGRN